MVLTLAPDGAGQRLAHGVSHGIEDELSMKPR